VAASKSASASSAPKAGGQGPKPGGKAKTESKGPQVQQTKGSVQRSSHFGIDFVNGAMVSRGAQLG
jgi:hypothetical protein